MSQAKGELLTYGNLMISRFMDHKGHCVKNLWEPRTIACNLCVFKDAPKILLCIHKSQEGNYNIQPSTQ